MRVVVSFLSAPICNAICENVVFPRRFSGSNLQEILHEISPHSSRRSRRGQSIIRVRSVPICGSFVLHSTSVAAVPPWVICGFKLASFVTVFTIEDRLERFSERIPKRSLGVADLLGFADRQNAQLRAIEIGSTPVPGCDCPTSSPDLRLSLELNHLQK